MVQQHDLIGCPVQGAGNHAHLFAGGTRAGWLVVEANALFDAGAVHTGSLATGEIGHPTTVEVMDARILHSAYSVPRQAP